MLTKLALILFTLVVAPTALGASQAEHFRAIAKFFNIEASEALASAQQANLNPNFSANFATLDDLNEQKVTRFGRNYPDRIVAFRDYLQLLTEKGYVNADQALSFLQLATRSAADTGLHVIRASNRKVEDASTIATVAYDAKLPPPTTAMAEVTSQNQSKSSTTPDRDALYRVSSASALERNTYADLAVVADTNKIYSNGTNVSSYARINALLALTRKTQPFYLDGALGLTTGKRASIYSSRNEDLRSVQALLGAGVYSGDYKNSDFIGLQSSVGISSEWYSGSIDGFSMSGRDTYVSLGIVGGNGNTAVGYKVRSPTTDFINSGSHAINLYFPYEKRDNSTNYFGVGILYSVSPGQESVGLVFRSGILSNAK